MRNKSLTIAFLSDKAQLTLILTKAPAVQPASVLFKELRKLHEQEGDLGQDWTLQLRLLTTLASSLSSHVYCLSL